MSYYTQEFYVFDNDTVFISPPGLRANWTGVYGMESGNFYYGPGGTFVPFVGYSGLDVFMLTALDGGHHGPDVTIGSTVKMHVIPASGTDADQRFDWSGYGEGVIVDAGGGNDIIIGGNGDDLLRGGAGIDRLKGGAGGDSFLFDKSDLTTSKDGTMDHIIDFSQADGDTVLLTGFSTSATFEFVKYAGNDVKMQIYEVSDGGVSQRILIQMADSTTKLAAGDYVFA